MKAKSSILTVVLSLLLASGLLAQEKYEFATVSSYLTSAKTGKLYVSKAHGYEEIDFQTQPGSDLNNSKIIEYVEKMQNEGWEVYNTEQLPARGIMYYLRKKKN